VTGGKSLPGYFQTQKFTRNPTGTVIQKEMFGVLGIEGEKRVFPQKSHTEYFKK